MLSLLWTRKWSPITSGSAGVLEFCPPLVKPLLVSPLEVVPFPLGVTTLSPFSVVPDAEVGPSPFI